MKQLSTFERYEKWGVDIKYIISIDFFPFKG